MNTCPEASVGMHIVSWLFPKAKDDLQEENLQLRRRPDGCRWERRNLQPDDRTQAEMKSRLQKLQALVFALLQSMKTQPIARMKLSIAFILNFPR